MELEPRDHAGASSARHVRRRRSPSVSQLRALAVGIPVAYVGALVFFIAVGGAMSGARVDQEALLGAVFLAALFGTGISLTLAAGSVIVFAMGWVSTRGVVDRAMGWIGAHRVAEGEMIATREVLDDLCVAAAMRTAPVLWCIDSDSVNVAAVARDQDESAIAVTRGFTVCMTPGEQRAILANPVVRIGSGLLGRQVRHVFVPDPNAMSSLETRGMRFRPAAWEADRDSFSLVGDRGLAVAAMRKMFACDGSVALERPTAVDWLFYRLPYLPSEAQRLQEAQRLDDALAGM